MSAEALLLLHLKYLPKDASHQTNKKTKNGKKKKHGNTLNILNNLLKRNQAMKMKKKKKNSWENIDIEECFIARSCRFYYSSNLFYLLMFCSAVNLWGIFNDFFLT